MFLLFRTLALIALVSFLLHFVWESLHVRLYTGYGHWSGGLPITLVATVGDVLYTLGAFALVSALKKSTGWVYTVSLTDFFALAALGFFIALFVEYKGLALGRWQYLPEMPMIPYLHVGASPIIQMTTLLPVTLLLVSLLKL